MTEKLDEIPDVQNRPSTNKVGSCLGMLIYLGLALMISDMAYGLQDMNSGNLHFYGVFFGACIISAATASFLFGYRLFMPLKRHGWIKNKAATSATLSVVLFLFLAVSFPGAHEYAIRAKDSEVKSNLKHMVAACQAYWKEMEKENGCNLKVASKEEYGFIQSNHIIHGKGNEKEFTARARHLNSKKEFGTNAHAIIFEYSDSLGDWIISK